MLHKVNKPASPPKTTVSYSEAACKSFPAPAPDLLPGAPPPTSWGRGQTVGCCRGSHMPKKKEIHTHTHTQTRAHAHADTAPAVLLSAGQTQMGFPHTAAPSAGGERTARLSEREEDRMSCPSSIERRWVGDSD